MEWLRRTGRIAHSGAAPPDAALALALLLVGMVEATWVTGGIAVPVAGVLVLLTVPLTWRRTFPRAVALVVTAGLVVQVPWAAARIFDRTFTGFVCVLLASYALGRRSPARRALPVVAVCALSFASALGWQDASAVTFGLALVFVVASATTGAVVASRAELRDLIDRQSEVLLHDSEVAERTRVAEVRGRIAGEVQALVNRRVREMVDRAGVARRLAPTDRIRAAQVVATVEQDGRTALDEMRTMLGVLRSSDLTDPQSSALPSTDLHSSDLRPFGQRTFGRRSLGRQHAGGWAHGLSAGRPEGLVFIAVVVLAIVEVWMARGEFPLVSVTLLAPLVAFTVAARTDLRPAVAGLGLALVAITALTRLVVRGGWGDYVFPVVLLLCAWLGGRLVRNQNDLVRRARLGAAALERSATVRASAAATRERMRLARELHDVLAHTLMVMVVQAGAARRSLESARPGADEALRVVVETGRDASTELRRLLTLIDPGDHATVEETGGTPGLHDLGLLVERACAAGLDAELVVEGEAGAIPSGLALTIFRVAQEAVTNVIRHAGATRVTLLLRHERGRVHLEVRDDGMPLTDAVAGAAGNGITGMRERAAIYGGELSAGRALGTGYVVTASFPLVGRFQDQPV